VPLGSLVATAAVAKEHDRRRRVAGRHNTRRVIVVAAQHETELTVGPAI